jgi:hypothetical protein
MQSPYMLHFPNSDYQRPASVYYHPSQASNIYTKQDGSVQNPYLRKPGTETPYFKKPKDVEEAPSRQQPEFPPMSAFLTGIEHTPIQPVKKRKCKSSAVPELMSADPAHYEFTTLSSRVTVAESFNAYVTKYLEAMGTPVEKVPIVHRKQLSFWALFHGTASNAAVLELGGSFAVTRARKWKRVAIRLKFPDTMTSSSYTLRTYFEQFLSAFEKEYVPRLPELEKLVNSQHYLLPVQTKWEPEFTECALNRPPRVRTSSPQSESVQELAAEYFEYCQ